MISCVVVAAVFCTPGAEGRLLGGHVVDGRCGLLYSGWLLCRHGWSVQYGDGVHRVFRTITRYPRAVACRDVANEEAWLMAVAGAWPRDYWKRQAGTGDCCRPCSSRPDRQLVHCSQLSCCIDSLGDVLSFSHHVFRCCHAIAFPWRRRSRPTLPPSPGWLRGRITVWRAISTPRDASFC